MVKIIDVAKYAKVSVSTVSRILSKDDTFSASQETIDKVNEAVNALGYKPLRKREKSKKNNKAINILMTVNRDQEDLDPYWAEMRVNVINFASRNNFEINRVLHLDEDLHSEDFKGVDGNIVLGTMSIKSLEDLGLDSSNTIIVDNSNEYSSGYDKVTSDLYEATIANLKTLIEKGHKKIAFLGGSIFVKDMYKEELKVSEDMRSKAYREFMMLHDFFDENLMVIGDWSSKDGNRMAKELVNRNVDFTAIVTASDPIAIGAVHALREIGLKVPEDVSIISFDNIEASEFMSPPLSTVDLNSIELGRQAINLLNQRIEGRTIPIKIVVQSNLIERESVITLKEG